LFGLSRLISRSFAATAGELQAYAYRQSGKHANLTGSSHGGLTRISQFLAQEFN
jgi:hypothetical protein